MAQRVRVLIADDQPRVRQALRALLATWSLAIIIGEVGDGREAVQVAQEAQPDLALLDVRMPGISGIEATALIKASCARTRIIVMSIYADCEEQALAAGADAYLNKVDVPQLLLSVIERLIGGEN